MVYEVGAHGRLVVRVGDGLVGKHEDDGVVDDEGAGLEEVSSSSIQSPDRGYHWLEIAADGGRKRAIVPAPRSSSGDWREA